MGNRLQIPIQDYGNLLKQPCGLNIVSAKAKLPVDGLRDGVPKTRQHDAVIKLQHDQHHLTQLCQLGVDLFQDINVVLLARKGSRIHLYRTGWKCRDIEYCVSRETISIKGIKFHLKAAAYSQAKFYFAFFSSHLKKLLGISEPFRIIYRSRNVQQQKPLSSTFSTSADNNFSSLSPTSIQQNRITTNKNYDNETERRGQVDQRKTQSEEKQEKEKARGKGQSPWETQSRSSSPSSPSAPPYTTTMTSTTTNTATRETNLLDTQRSSQRSILYADFLFSSDGCDHCTSDGDVMDGNNSPSFKSSYAQYNYHQVQNNNSVWNSRDSSSSNLTLAPLQVSDRSVRVHF